MSQLTITLLGSPQIELDGQEIKVRRKKAMALLSYLALTNRSVRRETLAALLWPEAGASQARAALRTALAHLTRKLGKSWFDSQRQTIGLRSSNSVWVDIGLFRKLLRMCTKHGHAIGAPCQACLPLMTEAIALYQNDFLLGFTLPDSSQWDEWQSYQTEVLRQEFIQTLAQLVGYYDQHDFLKSAILYARRLVTLDRLNEPARRQLMTLLHKSGQTAVALQQYQQLKAALEQELGVVPQAETTQLYHQIRQMALESPSFPSESLTNNLPQPLTPFIGRETELVEIKRRLQNPNCRLLTITGPGGIGKSRLGLTAATQLQPFYQHGVCFVSLTTLESSQQLMSALASALKIRFYGADDNQTQLLNYLREKELILLLDNFEHLTTETGLLATICQNAPRVKIIITSRISLNLQIEWLYEIEGLPHPQIDNDGKVITAYEAGELFMQRASHVNVRLKLEDAELKAIKQICQLVEGFPLGLELAAALTRAFSCKAIATEITQNLDFLTASATDLPKRHRSLRAVFQASWQQLTAAEKAIFVKLSVFRGGFTREAATAVAGANTAVLLGLVDKSFLRLVTSERYEIHEVLRWFGAERLALSPSQEVEVYQKHSTYYCQTLADREQHFQDARQLTVLDEVEADIKNIRSAWQWTINNKNRNNLALAIEGLYQFYNLRGRPQEGATIFAQAHDALKGHADIALAKGLMRLGAFKGAIGEFEIAQQYLQKGLHISRLLADKKETAFALCQVGIINKSNLTARTYWEESLALAEEISDKPQIADTLNWMAFVNYQKGDLETAVNLLERCLALSRETNNAHRLAHALNNLGLIYAHWGEDSKALQILQDALQIRKQIHDLRGIAAGCNNLCYIAINMDDYAAAHIWAKQALIHSRESGDKYYIGLALGNLSEIAFYQGHYKQSRKMCQECIELFEELDISTSPYLNILGQIAIKEADYEFARNIFQKALDKAPNTHLSLNILTGIASIMAHDDLLETGIDLLQFILQHEVTESFVKNRAASLLTKWQQSSSFAQAQLPPSRKLSLIEWIEEAKRLLVQV